MMKKRNDKASERRESKPLGAINNINYEAFVEDEENDEFLIGPDTRRRRRNASPRRGENNAPAKAAEHSGSAKATKNIAPSKVKKQMFPAGAEKHADASKAMHTAPEKNENHITPAKSKGRRSGEKSAKPAERNDPAKSTERKPPARTAERVCLAVLGTALCAVSAYNAFQSNRPTVSESENRPLTPMPTYSAEALRSGEYFSGLSLHFSDTFIGRERLMSLSQKIGSLTGPRGGLSVLDAPAMTDDTLSPDEEQRLEELGRRAAKRWNGDKASFFKRLAEPPEAVTVTLSESDITLYVGSTATLDITVTGTGELSLSCSGDAASATLDGESIIITANAEGDSTLTLTYGESSSSCDIHVRTAGVSENQGAEADFIGSGMFIYGDAVYTISGYGETAVGYLAQCAQYYASLFPGTRVSVLPCPVSAIVVDDPDVTANFTDQKWVLDAMQSRFTDTNFVNSYSEIYSHRKEYLYFKSDHHWTQLGAYYAYRAFAESVGLTPTPLSDMQHEVINDDFQGSMYSFTGDARVKSFPDSVEVYYPTKAATMTVTRRDGSTRTYDRLIISEYGSYLSFIASDNPFTVINVPSNPQDRSILVLKDSYGNAFVPFLAEHYGNIIVIDPRYCDENIAQTYKNYGLTDILFVGNIQSHNSVAWSRYFYKCVGVDMG